MDRSQTSDDGKLSDEAIRQAADWFARLRASGPTDEVRREFRDWLAEDPEHHRAFAATKALWYRMDDPARLAGAGLWYRQGLGRPARRRKRLASLATAAVLFGLLCSAALWRDAGLIDRAMADYATHPGEQREIRLADGSLAFLDGDSALDVDMTGAGRQVRLLRGRVWFDVKHDPARPFTVHSGIVDTRVLGTAFAVDSGVRSIDVTVERGHVAVSLDDGEAVNLEAGEQVSVTLGHLAEKSAADVESRLAWRRGLLVLNHTPLADVAEALSRMTTGRVVLRESEANAGIFLTGVFRVDNPDAVVSALRSAGVNAVHIAGLATVIY